MVKNIAALVKVVSLVPNTHVRRLTAACNSSYKSSSTLFRPPQGPTHV